MAIMMRRMLRGFKLGGATTGGNSMSPAIGEPAHRQERGYRSQTDLFIHSVRVQVRSQIAPKVDSGGTCTAAVRTLTQ